MKILFATEYYRPFTPGGTSWSLELLARELGRRGHRVVVVTPSYGAPPREIVDGVAVVRFPFWRRLSPGPSLAPARDHVNPLFHALMARGHGVANPGDHVGNRIGHKSPRRRATSCS